MIDEANLNLKELLLRTHPDVNTDRLFLAPRRRGLLYLRHHPVLVCFFFA